MIVQEVYMTKKAREIDRSRLIELGLKEALLDKLSDSQINDLLAYSIDESKNKELLKNLILLASMELHNKHGVIFLAVSHIATPQQLKNLTADQVEMLVSDYNYHHDLKLAIKSAKRFIVINQQEKMYFESGGVKGEYFIDPHSTEEDEETA